eukprot:1155857-Pelagomonas_calceolata.AAC.4
MEPCIQHPLIHGGCVPCEFGHRDALNACRMTQQREYCKQNIHQCNRGAFQDAADWNKQPQPCPCNPALEHMLEHLNPEY